MTTTTIVRWGAAAAVVVGLALLLPMQWPLLRPSASIVYRLAIAVFAVGIYLFQRDEAGTLGLLGALFAFLGNLLAVLRVVGSIEILVVGLILIGVAALRARTLPSWIALLFVVAIGSEYGAVLASSLIGLSGSTYLLPWQLFSVLAIASALAFLAVGYGVWSKVQASSAAP